MLRIVLDTNVLVSAFLKPRSKPAKILRLVLQGDIDIICNESILLEYHDVLRRPKFNLKEKKVRTILDTIRLKAIKAPALAASFSLPDPDDEPFLEAALAAQADFLITGNEKHFPSEVCKMQNVLTPKEFLDTLPA